MRSCVFFFFILLCILQQPCSTRADAPVADPLRSVQADFIQEKHLKMLARPLVSTGTFVFQAPESLRWEYKKPVGSILLMHGGKIRKYLEKNGRLEEQAGFPFDSMQVILAEIGSWLDGRIAENDMFEVAYPAETKILLTPKGRIPAGLISKIELQLAAQHGLLESVRIYEGPDSYTLMRFHNSVLNQNVPTSLFTEK